MSLGSYLKSLREESKLSLRDVQKFAKEQQIGAELSCGYLSMLERDAIKQPSPRVLYTLAAIYEADYMHIMKEAGYIPNETKLNAHRAVTFRGTSRLDQEQRERIQRIIDFELSEAEKTKRKQN